MADVLSHDRELELLRKIEALAIERDKYLSERDMWHARAAAMFWRIPGDVTIAELRADAERARAFLLATKEP